MPKMTEEPKPLPPAKRITVTLSPPVVRWLLDEQHRRRLAGENATLSSVVVERLEHACATPEGS